MTEDEALTQAEVVRNDERWSEYHELIDALAEAVEAWKRRAVEAQEHKRHARRRLRNLLDVMEMEP